MAWRTQFKIKDLFLDRNDVSRSEAKALGEVVAKRLETPEAVLAFGSFYANNLVNLFRNDTFSQADFNANLDVLYDYADERRVWVE